MEAELDYAEAVAGLHTSPGQLEYLYRQARQEGSQEKFTGAIRALHQANPEDPLWAAWYYRLEASGRHADEPAVRLGKWKYAVPVAVLTGLIFWALSGESWIFLDQVPHLVIFWAPIAALGTLAYLALLSGENRNRALLATGILAGACVYVLFVAPLVTERHQEYYLILMATHLPLLAWIGIGYTILGIAAPATERFAFLTKSFEVMITAGVYLIAGMAFGGLTIGMFAALSIDLPETLLRLIAAGGFGLIPVIAVASVYNPASSPSQQDFSQGLSKFINTMMRLMLPLAIIVLAVYLFVIPFNFMQPFNNRDVLIVFNLLLFGILGLLAGATPLQLSDLTLRLQSALRTGLILVAGLAVLISLYALAAIIYRTLQGGLTINRLTIIGWNLINISLLAILLYRQARLANKDWVAPLKATFSLGTTAYTAWTIFLILVIPWLFR